MFFAFYPYSKITIFRPCKTGVLLQFREFICGKGGNFGGKQRNLEVVIRFVEHPVACNSTPSFYSSWSSRNSNSTSHSSSAFRGQYVENDVFNDNEDEYANDKGLGSNLSGASISYDTYSRACGNECNFGNLDVLDESDEEEEETEGEDDSDDDFRVLNLVKGNGQQTEDIRTEQDDSELRHPLLKEVCRCINLHSSWTPKLEWEMRHLLRSLTPRQVCAVLRDQADERVALNFFYWADRQWRYRHDPIVYYAMLEVLSKTKLCQGAKRVLRLLTRRRVQLLPEAFGYVMVSFSRAGHLRKALQVLTVMQKAGVEPDLSICNTTVNILVEANRLEKALRFLERMKIIGIAPNVVTYNCLIKGYCDAHRMDDAMDLIAELSSKGCHPDKISYYTVMGFLCKEKRIKEVRELMQKMTKDSKLLPDQITYNTLIHMLSKHGHGDEAVGFLREAEEAGFSIDKVGYSAIVHSFCQEGNIERAREIVNEMLSKGCSPDVVTYTSVVDGFCRVGKVGQAKKLLQQMYRHGCKPNTVSYTALLNGLCRSGKSSDAREMMNMSEEEWWTPNAITYSVLVHGFRREGKLFEACDLVREMLTKGFYPTPVEINLLIQSLCRKGRADDAKKFMQECLRKGCAVNVVNFTSVIYGFCQRDDLDAALSVLDDMYLVSKHPDAVTYTTIINALGRKGRMEEAAELLKKMLHRGLLPTPITYMCVIHRFCQHDRVDDLLKLLEKMLSRQQHKTAYNQVIEKLCSFGKLDDAYKLIGKVLRTASRIDANTCHMLMKSYLKKGIPLSSYNLACRMFCRNLIPDLKLCEKVSKQLRIEGKTDEADKLMLKFVERGRILPFHQQEVKS